MLRNLLNYLFNFDLRVLVRIYLKTSFYTVIVDYDVDRTGVEAW
jgi:hypothetical protein